MGLRDFRIEPTIAIANLARTKDFYGVQLDLGANDDESGGVLYTCGEATQVFVYTSAQNAGQSSATVAGWFVDDLDVVMTDLSSRGVTFEHYDQGDVVTDERGVFEAAHLRAAWFKDPDGNILAISQRR